MNKDPNVIRNNKLSNEPFEGLIFSINDWCTTDYDTICMNPHVICPDQTAYKRLPGKKNMISKYVFK